MPQKICRSLIVGCCLTLATLPSVCADRRATAEVGPLPVAPTADSTGPARAGPRVAEVSQDIQAISIHIQDGRFVADVYDAQSRPIRLEVSSANGPYLLAIDGLLEPRTLDADGASVDTTIIGPTLPNPGRYTMRLSGSGAATATPKVRPAYRQSRC